MPPWMKASERYKSFFNKKGGIGIFWLFDIGFSVFALKDFGFVVLLFLLLCGFYVVYSISFQFSSKIQTGFQKFFWFVFNLSGN